MDRVKQQWELEGFTFTCVRDDMYELAYETSTPQGRYAISFNRTDENDRRIYHGRYLRPGSKSWKIVASSYYGMGNIAKQLAKHLAGDPHTHIPVNFGTLRTYPRSGQFAGVGRVISVYRGDNEHVGELYKEDEMIEWAGDGSIEELGCDSPTCQTCPQDSGVSDRDLEELKKKVTAMVNCKNGRSAKRKTALNKLVSNLA